MTGYVRVDTGNNIADGNVISAADLDNEFDGVQSAFNVSTGHTHGGAAGEGAPITKLGPTQDVTASSSLLAPKTTNTVDVGSSLLKFKDLYLAGNASIGGTLAVTGVATFTAQPVLSSLTASKAVFSDGSKGLVSNDITGTGNVVMSNSPTLVTPALGTPSSVTLTNATGLPVATGISGLGTGVAAFLATPSSANLASAVSDETGTGALVFANSPTLVTPALGTPSSGTLTNGTGLPIATGVSGLGTGIATALAVNVGSAGAPVINGGALGTPSSGTVTNLTGTASININGTVGATTANTGAFTTLTTSSTVTHNGGTANGVAYLNGSKVLTTGSALTFDGTNLGIGTSAPLTALNVNGTGGELIRISVTADGATQQEPALGFATGVTNTHPAAKISALEYDASDSRASLLFYTRGTNGDVAPTERMRIDSSGNLGLGATPSAWGGSFKPFQVGSTGALWGASSGAGSLFLSANTYFDGTNFRYLNTANATFYAQSSTGIHSWNTAPSGTAGNAISFTQAMTLDASQRLMIGTTSSYGGNLTLIPTNGNPTTASSTLNQIAIGEASVNSAYKLFVGYLNIGGGYAGSVQAIAGGAGTNLLLNADGGNVGIGTSSPGTKLDVSGNLRFSAANPVIEFNNGGAQVYSTTANTLQFATGGGIGSATERARITSGGNFIVGGTNVLQSATISSYGPVSALNSAADANYQNAFVGVYSANNNEHNAIQTAVSSVAANSGFRFMVSDGGGSSGTTQSFRINRTSCTVIGSLSKGSGSFKIDHPLTEKTDTHHLVHSFIEGPQADLIYRGKVSLVAGTASVDIDTAAGMTAGTFVALCRDVQCFTTNESDWTAVRGSVAGNILTIEAQDNTSTASISWMVIGERKDKHMYDTDWTDNDGKVIVEPLKLTHL